MNEKRPAFFYYGKSYRISQKNPWYITIKKTAQAYDKQIST